jgi:hypothetical protein
MVNRLALGEARLLLLMKPFAAPPETRLCMTPESKPMRFKTRRSNGFGVDAWVRRDTV